MLMTSFPTRFATSFVVAALAGFVAPSACGDTIVTYQDVGSDLQFRWSGSLAFNTGSADSTIANTRIRTGTQEFNGEQSFFGMNTAWTQNGPYTYTRSPGPNTDYIFSGNPNFNFPGSAAFGDAFGFRLNNATQANVFAPVNYTSRSDISGGMTIAGQSVSSTGITDASFTLSSGDTKQLSSCSRAVFHVACLHRASQRSGHALAMSQGHFDAQEVSVGRSV
jgi:hypothetical protein